MARHSAARHVLEEPVGLGVDIFAEDMRPHPWQ